MLYEIMHIQSAFDVLFCHSIKSHLWKHFLYILNSYTAAMSHNIMAADNSSQV